MDVSDLGSEENTFIGFWWSASCAVPGAVARACRHRVAGLKVAVATPTWVVPLSQVWTPLNLTFLLRFCDSVRLNEVYSFHGPSGEYVFARLLDFGVEQHS